jgi:capsular exopolysaccharide synthesis family protein
MSRVYRALQKAEREKEEKPREEYRQEEHRAKEYLAEESRAEEPRKEEFRPERVRTEEPRTEEPRTVEQHRATVKEKVVARIDQGILHPSEIKAEQHEFPLGDEASVLRVPPDSFAAEQFRKLKTEIFHASSNPPHIILVTSTTPNEGKSTVSFNLASSISQEIQKRAILVDADLRRPSVLFKKHKASRGLSNYLSDRIPLAEILVRFEENFWIVPAGPSSRKSSELLGTRRMSELLGSLREFGEDTYTIIDSPPILSTSEPAMLSKMVDAVILVVKADQTPRESVRRAVQSIDRKKILGVVFNHVELKSLSYYSKYYHGYYGK